MKKLSAFFVFGGAPFFFVYAAMIGPVFSQDSCDGVQMTITGKITAVDDYSSENWYRIETLHPQCDEIQIRVIGRLPPSCDIGRTVSVTGLVKDIAGPIAPYDMSNPSQIVCY